MVHAILYIASLLLALTGACLVVVGIRRLVSRGRGPYAPPLPGSKRPTPLSEAAPQRPEEITR